MSPDNPEHGGPDCKAIFESLSEYLDDELPEDFCRTFEQHMDGCPPCQTFLDSLRRTIRLIENVDAPPLPDEIRQSVREAYARYRDEGGAG